MSFIRTIDPAEADEPLRTFYAELCSRFGRVPDLFKLQSPLPATLAAHLELYRSLVDVERGLPAIERAAISLAVSVANNCNYGAHDHASELRHCGGSESLILSLKLGESPETKSARLQHLIYCARKLTLLPNAMNTEDIQQLRKHGLTELEINQFVQIVAYFNFTDRIALALGATPEE